MHLDRLLPGTEIRGNLLIEATSNDLCHDLPFTRGKSLKAFSNRGSNGAGYSLQCIASQCLVHRCEQLHVVDWLGQKVNRASLHRVDSDMNVTHARQKYNGPAAI